MGTYHPWWDTFGNWQRTQLMRKKSFSLKLFFADGKFENDTLEYEIHKSAKLKRNAKMYFYLRIQFHED